MNDPLNDPLDYKLRTMMRTAVADLPPAPHVEDIATTDLRVAMDHTNGGSQPWRVLIGAAAAVTLVIGAVAIWSLRSEQQLRQSASIPTSPQPTNGGEYWLPSELPAGWRIVDLVQGGSGVGSGSVEVGNTFVFERPSDRARIVVQLPPVNELGQGANSPVPPDALTLGTWIAESRTIAWAGSPSYEVHASSSLDDEAAVRAALQRMVISLGATGLVAALAPDEAEWRLVETYVLNTDVPSSWQASFVVASVDGRQAQVIYEPYGPVPPLPVLLDAGVVLPIDPSTPTFTGTMMLRDGVAFDVGGYGIITDLTEVAGTILSSMKRVDRLAWNGVRAQFASDLLASPATFDAEVLGVTVTAYNDGLLSGTCFRRGDASGCSPLVLGEFPFVLGQTMGNQIAIELGDGSWAIAATFPPNVTLSPCGSDEATGTRVAVTQFGDQQLALVLPGPGMDSYSCTIPSDPDKILIFGIRPLA